MRVTNEAQFQRWFKDIFLPILSEGTVVVSDGNNRNGVSDLTWIVPGCGVFAIELKYTKILERSPNSRFLNNHKLSALQALFMHRWASALTERHALVVVGTDQGDVFFYSGDVVTDKIINDMFVSQRHDLSSCHVNSVVGKNKSAILKTCVYDEQIEQLREFIFGGEFDVEE